MAKNAAAKRAPSLDNAAKRARKSKAVAVLERKPVSGWATSDDDEIGLRRWRGCTEIRDVVALEPDRSFFGDFRVRSASGGCYEVEIRALDKLANSCGCIDHRVNSLGTCKHIEGVLAALRRGKVRAFRAATTVGSPRIEVFLDRRGEAAPALAWPFCADEASLAKHTTVRFILVDKAHGVDSSCIQRVTNHLDTESDQRHAPQEYRLPRSAQTASLDIFRHPGGQARVR